MVPKYAIHIENTIKIKRNPNRNEYRSCNNIHPSLFTFKSDFFNIQEYYYAVNEYGTHYVGKPVKPLMYSDNFTDVNGIGARNELIIDTYEILGVEHPVSRRYQVVLRREQRPDGVSNGRRARTWCIKNYTNI